MAKKKKMTRKELLKGEDEFISVSGRIVNYIASHSQHIKYSLIILVVASALTAGAFLWLRYMNNKSMSAYNLANKKVKGINISEAEIDTEEIQSAIQSFNKIKKKYGWTKAAELSVPHMAFLEFARGNYKESESLYRSYLNDDNPDPIYHSMARFGIAASCEAMGDYKTAIVQLKEIIDDEDSFLKEEAMFTLGRLYALDGQEIKSRKTFRGFVNQFNTSPLVPVARANMKKSS